MGLDMYLLASLQQGDSEEQIGYWRKSNQIHNWFSQFMEREDDSSVEINRAQLEELQSLCAQVLYDHDLAPKLLPTVTGFFFGSQDYDEWYFKDVEDTLFILGNALENFPDDTEFTYVASW